MVLTQMSKRLQTEYARISKSTPPGITYIPADEGVIDTIFMDIEVIGDHPIYQDKTFRLKFGFDDFYPSSPPDVRFVTVSNGSTKREIPMHPHVYSNGIICLDLLTLSGWSPAQTIETICLSIQSILSGNTIARRPVGDQDVVERFKTNHSRDIEFEFHNERI